MRVIAKLDTTHLKYGDLKTGQEYEIDPADFGDQIFDKIDQREGGKGKTTRPLAEKEG